MRRIKFLISSMLLMFAFGQQDAAAADMYMYLRNNGTSSPESPIEMTTLYDGVYVVYNRNLPTYSYTQYNYANGMYFSSAESASIDELNENTIYQATSGQFSQGSPSATEGWLGASQEGVTLSTSTYTIYPICVKYGTWDIYLDTNTSKMYVLNPGEAANFLDEYKLPSVGITYEYADGTNTSYKVTGFTNELPAEITIPSVHEGLPVVAIGDGAFSGCTGLTSVIIPFSVTGIGNSAFSGCTSLSSAYIPNSVAEIGESAFYGCSALIGISIPGSVTSIGASAFANCSGLNSVCVDNPNPASISIGDDIFLNAPTGSCTLFIPVGSQALYQAAPQWSAFGTISPVTMQGLTYVYTDATQTSYKVSGFTKELPTNVIIPDKYNGLPVVAIGNYAFYGSTNLSSIIIPNSVNSIGQYAFYNCSGLSEVTIPASVTSIGTKAFNGCAGLAGIHINRIPEVIASDAFNGVTALFHFYDENPGTYVYNSCTIFVPATALEAYRTAWPEHASEIFANGTGSYDVTVTARIDESGLLNAITDLAVDDDGSIEALLGVVNLKVRGTINSYDVMVMHNKMLNLANIDLSEATIVANSYEYYTGCHTEDNVVGTRFLCNMSNLQSVKLPNSATTIKAGAITDGSPKLKIIEIGSGTQTIEAIAFKGINTLAKVIIGNGVTSIGANAFQSCSRLSQVEFGEGLQTIGNFAFDGCSTLSAVDFNNSLQSIGDYAFHNCSKLNVNEISVPTIGQYAFYGCTSINPLQITATIVGNSAFLRCSGLVNLNLTSPAGGSLGNYAFQNCTGLKTAVIDTETIGNYIFNGCTNLKSLTFGDKVVTMGQEICSGCKSLSEVTFGENVETINAAAFANCTALASVILPEKLTKVNLGTFYGCTALESVAFPPALTEIAASTIRSSSNTYDKGPFENCSNLLKIMLPTSLQIIGAYSFTGCSSLAEVKIPSSITTIGDHAFSTSVRDIYTYTIEPTEINQNTFESNLYTDATLHVPATAKKLYFYDTYWSQFIHIVTDAGNQYEYFYLTDRDLIMDEGTERLEGVDDKDVNADMGEGSGLVVEGEDEQVIGDLNLDCDGEDSGSIIGGLGLGDGNIHVKNLRIRIKVKKNKWYFFAFPFDIDREHILYEGESVWRYYNGEARAENHRGGWEDVTENQLNAWKGYIFQGNVDGTLILEVGEKRFRKENQQIHLLTHASDDLAHASWNFVGNPFTSYYSLDDLGYYAPVTIWNGSTYEAFTPGDDEYLLHPYQAFFVQKGTTSESVEYSADYRVTRNQGHDDIFMDNLHKGVRSINRAPRSSCRYLVNLEISDGETTDRTRVVFNEESSAAYELDNDAAKFLTKTAPQVYTIDSKNTLYAINERPLSDGTVKVGFYAPKEGTYTFSTSRMDKEMMIVDMKTGKKANLADGYTFTAKEGTDNDRFMLVPVEDADNASLNSASICDDTEEGVEYFSLDGISYGTNPPSGMAIRRDSKGSRKVFIP